MRVLVTGSNGFVGKHACDALRARGHEVIGAGFAPSATDTSTLALDVRDFVAVTDVVAKARPDAVLHLAAIAFVPQAKDDPSGAFAINAQGTLHVLAALAASAKDARCVVVSSAEVYGRVSEAEMPLSERRAPMPVTVYGASKAAAEHLARAYAADGLDVRVLRPFNHVGPGQDDRFVVASFARQVAQLERTGGGVVLHGNLSAVRDFLDVRDVANVYALALEAERGVLAPGVPFNVCSGLGRTIESIVRAFAERARAPVELRLDPSRLRAVDVPTFVGAPDALRTALRWEPAFAWGGTIEDVLDDARSR
ncbi:MAG: GDP-mannose 4,6-dehydratase [Planctomycetes bacterium]|nr:GDP-mannose 4,6-dehydratase [Planctomycetota bacterium]MCC7172673.1 GDP-mannose 4,6-dehydratase [Planctomycetota bacterium]